MVGAGASDAKNDTMAVRFVIVYPAEGGSDGLRGGDGCVLLFAVVGVIGIDDTRTLDCGMVIFRFGDKRDLFYVVALVPHQLPGKVDPRRWHCKQSHNAAARVRRHECIKCGASACVKGC